MKTIKHILLVLTIILSSCSKDDDNPTIISNEEGYDIHIVGNVSIEESSYTKAMHWKNNVATLLDKSDVKSTATAVIVVDKDVYICGSLNYKACYWKNGTVVYLPEGTDAYDIKVIGTDVYVAGENNSVACYWKNGEKTTLADTANQSLANAITIVGNDVYVAGEHSVGKNQYKYQPTYWKNNVPTYLGEQGQAYDILVNGGDVYVAGYALNETANIYRAYWKNDVDVITPLEKNQNYVYSTGLAVNNNEIYVSGYIGSYLTQEPCYWKNGKTIKLPNKSGATKAIANDIQVAEGTVFVCGYEEQSNYGYRPKIWINNVETFLSGSIKQGEPLDIFLAKK